MEFQITNTENVQNVALSAIDKAYSLGAKYNDLKAIRPGQTRTGSVLPHSIVGNFDLEEACRDVVEAIIALTASKIQDTPTPLIEPEGSFEVRDVIRDGWNCCTVMSTSYYKELEILLAFIETGSWNIAYDRGYRGMY